METSTDGEKPLAHKMGEFGLRPTLLVMLTKFDGIYDGSDLGEFFSRWRRWWARLN